jgi:glutamate racemase
MNSRAPIGIFDSGVGGLSVVGELRTVLPHEEFVYLADAAYCPYGDRPLEEIRGRSLDVARFLVRQDAKLIVVACNSASGAALETLRESLNVPIVGMEPAVKPAALTTRNGRVGVLATAATLQAERFDRLMANYAGDVEVVPQPAPGLVELVERGTTTGAEARAVLEPLLEPLRAARVDTVVLGCTHYPFLRSEISDILGPGVAVIDTGAAVARQVERVLTERDAKHPDGSGDLRIFTTGDPNRVARAVHSLLGSAVPVAATTI